MEDIYATQCQLMQSIEKLLVNFKKDGPERKTFSNIQRRLTTLKSYWNEFNSNHTQLVDYQDLDHDYFIQNCYEKTKEFYLKLLSYLENYSLYIENPTAHDIPSTPRPGAIYSFEVPPTVKSRQFKIDIPSVEVSQTTPTPTTSAIRALPSPLNGVNPASQEKVGEFLDRSTPSKLEEMLRKQRSNFKAFSRTITSIEEDLTEKWEFEDVLKNIESRWRTIDSLHWEIDSFLCEEDEEYMRLFNRYEKEYNDIKKVLTKKMWSSSYKTKMTPTMDIPTFNGDYHKWVSFKDLFSEAIHSNGSISKAQKMQFLKNKVKGEAEKLIQHLKISSENYQVCWDILNHRFNNVRKIFITYHMQILLSLPTMQQQSAASIKKMHDTTIECINAIKPLGVDISSSDPVLTHILSHKLDSETHLEYIESLKNPRELPTLSEFIQFLENKFTSLEASRRKQDTINQKPSVSPFYTKKPWQYQYSNNNNYSKPPTSNLNANYNQKPKSFYVPSANKCPHCDGDHGIFICKEFLDLPNEMKVKTVNKLQLCVNCLFDHKGKKCLSTKTCRKCSGKHNTLLHEAYINQPSSIPKHSSDNVYVSQSKLSEILLATTLIKVLALDGTYHIMRALVDQGSQISLITEDAAQRLGLPRRHCKGVVFGLGSQQNNCKGALQITASAIKGDFTFNTNVVIMKKLMHSLPNQTFEKPIWPHLKNIDLADPEFHISAPIDILLGAEVYSLIMMGGIIKGDSKTEPIAQQTHLGWLLCGKVTTYHCNVVLNNLEDIQRFWTIEDIADNPSDLTAEDHYCVTQYQEQTTRQVDGRYVVRYPMKPNFTEKLGDSKNRAIAQFLQLEKKFSKNQKLSDGYKSFINEYVSLGHMHQVHNDCNVNSPASCYLPHHCVLRSDSTTTALRVVVNASSPTTSGCSFNDLMYSGPNLQRDLLSLIINWRQYEIAFTADIEKMFRQIMVHPEDQNLQKIIWRNNSQEPLQEYNLATVTYGTKAAPFLAMMTLKQLAKDEGHNYPLSLARQTLEDKFYMDDLLSGSHSIPAAKQLQSDLLKLLKSGGFHLRKWASNKQELLQDVETNTKSFDFKHPESTKTLGLQWNPKDDHFSFKLRLSPPSQRLLSKRILLSEISKIFDPLGWLSPVTTKLKLLFQKVWLQDIQWDSELPKEISKEWQRIRDDLYNINNFKVQRWLATQENDNIELHGFCDSSTKAFACVILCRVKKPHNTINIVAGKSRLVPVKKTITLPRLELMACHLLAKLMNTVLKTLQNHNIKIYGWTDSTAVLGWLQGDSSRWKTFVANKVNQIKAIMPSEKWHYVKSTENPADCASRGISAKQLKEHQLWWTGPTWLISYEPEHNQKRPVYLTDLEMKQSHQSNVTTINNYNIISDIVNKHSDFARATRIVAWVLRAVSRSKSKKAFLSVDELSKARNTIIVCFQHLSFSNEISRLEGGDKIDSKSKILSLNPFLGKDQLLRVGGRIKHANIPEEMKYPLIIPHDSHLTNLLIDRAHKDTFHGGARLTHARLRQHYWIIGGNRAVKKRLRRCLICRRQDPVKQTQLMGDLPTARVNPSRPFHSSGVDLCAYVEVKANKGRGIKTTKAYVTVFVCMATKAVHLELVSDLSSSAFLAALRRMSARRGTPRHIYCDNGTNFVGANRILKQGYINLQAILDNEFHSQVSDMGIEFHFNAPAWPSAGGLWEAAVKSLKYHLRRVLGDQKLTYEEFTTLLAQLEGCLNSRPLGALTEDPEDIDFLTPSHFLSSGPTLTVTETERDGRTRWQLIQKMVNDIWKRWQNEYLCKLSSRCKWQQYENNQRVDDIVIIQEANLPPGKWALGRVVELHPGKDGHVRVASVKTKSGIIKRPIVKLSPLPVHDEISHHVPSNKQNNVSNVITLKPKHTTTSFKNMFITLLTLLLILPVQGAYNIAQLKHYQSIYFDKISDMHISRDEWKLIVYYDMDPFWRGSKILTEYVDNLESICEKSTKPSLCDIVLLQLHHDYSELELYNHILLGHQFTGRNSHRVRRGYINVVGNLASTLFGVLDDNFAEKYEKDIDQIRANQKHLSLFWKNQTSIIEAQYNVLQRVEDNMNKQHKLINQHINNIENTLNLAKGEVQKLSTSNDFALSAIVTHGLLTNLRNIQEYLLDTLVDLNHGTFNFHLINPEQLRDELNMISGQLPKDLDLPINNIPNDLPKLYHLLKVKAKMTKQFFIFEIKIPLVTRDYYEIYHLLPIPRSIEHKMISITTISEYIAINIQKDSFFTMSLSDLQECHHNDDVTYLCPLRKPVYRMTSDKNLCTRDEVTNQCKTDTIPCKTSWSALHEINKHLYTCCGQCSIRVICGSQISAEQLTGTGIISLSEGCVIKSESFTIYSHRLTYNTVNIAADVLNIGVPPINHIIEISLPSINNSSTIKDEQLNNQTYIHKQLLAIGEQIQQLKENGPEVELIEKTSPHDVTQYILICVIIIIFISICIAFVRHRLRTVSVTITGDQQATTPAISATAVTVPAQHEPPRPSLTASSATSPRFINKATSPICRTRFSDIS